MKKQFRNIRVKGEQYAWRASAHDGCDNGPFTKVTIWKNKKIFLEYDFPTESFSNPAVTPGMIANRINHELAKA